MAKTKDLEASREILENVEEFITFLSSTCQPDVAGDVSAQMARFWCFVYLAAK